MNEYRFVYEMIKRLNLREGEVRKSMESCPEIVARIARLDADRYISCLNEYKSALVRVLDGSDLTPKVINDAFLPVLATAANSFNKKMKTYWNPKQDSSSKIDITPPKKTLCYIKDCRGS